MIKILMKQIEDLHAHLEEKPQPEWTESFVMRRWNLMDEEYREMVHELSEGNKLKTACEGVDLIVTILGTLVQGGITPTQVQTIWDRIYGANMRKEPGPSGKWVKPEGWSPPDFSDLAKELS